MQRSACSDCVGAVIDIVRLNMRCVGRDLSIPGESIEGLRQVFDEADDIEIVGEAVDGAEVLAQVRESELDLLLLDLRTARLVRP